jgi:hypothetical protein
VRMGKRVKSSFIEKNLPSLEPMTNSITLAFASTLQGRPPCVRMDYSFAALTLGLVVQSSAIRKTRLATPQSLQRSA